MTKLALHNLWNYINGLMLSRDEALWLSERLLSSKVDDASVVPDASKAAQIEEKFKNFKISPSLQKLRGVVKMSDLDLEDDRTRYILGK